MEQTEYQKLKVLVQVEPPLHPPSLRERLNSLTRRAVESFLQRPTAFLVGALAEVVVDRLCSEYQLFLNETSKCRHHTLPPTQISRVTNHLDMAPDPFLEDKFFLEYKLKKRLN